MKYIKTIIFAFFAFRIIPQFIGILNIAEPGGFVSLILTGIAIGVFYEYLKQKEEEQEIIKQAEEFSQREKYYVKKYGDNFGSAIANKKIMVGMTKEMLIESWGQPGSVKQTVYKNSVKEKCYYAPRETRQNTIKYQQQVNLENNIVVGWSDL